MPEILGTSQSISGFDPRSIPGCILWLDSADRSTLFSDSAGTTAATISGPVGLWKDKSRVATNVSNATAGQRPTYTSNGLSYGGGQGLFGTPTTLSSGGVACFVVFIPSTPSIRRSIVRMWNGLYLTSMETTFNEIVIPSVYNYQAVSPTEGVYNIASVIAYNPNLSEWAVNVATSSTTWTFTGGPSTGTELAIGSRPGLVLPFVGTISEVIIYDAFLTRSQKQTIEGYLTKKWDMTTPTTHPFFRTPPLTRYFNPSDVPECGLWLDAADVSSMTFSGTSVTQWNDKSGNGRNYTTYVTPPVYSSTDGGSVTFSYGQAMQNYDTWVGNGASVDIFVVSTPWPHTQYNDWRTLFRADTSGHRVIIEYNSSRLGYYGNSGFNQFGSLTLGQTKSLLYMTTNASFVSSAALNGTTALSVAANTQGSDTSRPFYILGAYQGGPSQPWGTINEVMIFLNVTASQRQQIEGYLTHKWNLIPNLPAAHFFKTIPPSSVAQFDPRGVGGCAVWLDASDPAAALSGTTWLDKSGRANNFTTTSGTVSVILDGANRVVNIPNGAIMTSSASITFGLQSAIYIVFRATALSETGLSYPLGFSSINPSGNVGDYGIRLVSAGLVGTPVNPGGINDVGNANYFVNGAFNPNYSLSVYSNSYAVVRTTQFTLTGTSAITLSTSFFSRFFIGNIGELLYYPEGLTTPQRQQVEGYLAWKWGASEKLPTTHPFYKFSPALNSGSIFDSALTYIPLKTGIADLGTLPQNITNNGTVTFTTIAGRPCMYAPNSFSTYLSLPYTNRNTFTLCFWLYPLNTSYYTAVSITNPELNNPALQVDITGTSTTIYTAMPNQWTNQPTGTTRGANAWTHFAITINQSTFVEQLYLNGTLAATATGSGSTISSRTRFVLGRSGDGGRAYFGYISQFAFFPNVLTASDILTVYQTPA